MLFHSAEFLFLFLPVALVGYQIARRHAPLKWALGFLTLASFVFYGWEEPGFVLLLAGSLLLNFGVVQLLFRSQNEHLRWSLAALGVSFNIGLIGWFKYAGFLAQGVNTIVGTDWPVIEHILPLAISFFSFELIALVVDAYTRKLKNLRLLDLFLFVSFFPQLIAGPIVHHREIIPQLAERPKLDSRVFLAGLAIFSIGMFKKIWLADPLANAFRTCVSPLANGHDYGFVESWICTGTGIYVYFDFSAYMDMAMGLAILFGIRLPWSFLSPFKATTLAEFWRRWNMTLMRFLRLYVYDTLAGGSRRTLRRMFAVLVTMSLCGLWHGASDTLLLWGFLLGLVICFEVAIGLGAAHRRTTPWRKALGRLWVLFAFFVPGTFFLADDATQAVMMSSSLLGIDGWGPIGTAQLGLIQMLTLLVAWGLVYLAPNTYELFRKENMGSSWGVKTAVDHGVIQAAWNPGRFWAIATGLILGAGLLGMGRPEVFYYFRF